MTLPSHLWRKLPVVLLGALVIVWVLLNANGPYSDSESEPVGLVPSLALLAVLVPALYCAWLGRLRVALPVVAAAGAVFAVSADGNGWPVFHGVSLGVEVGVFLAVFWLTALGLPVVAGRILFRFLRYLGEGLHE